MLEILPYNSREEWLAARGEIRGIGGSDAATAVGLGKRKSVVQLWREKSGRAMAKDLSGLEYVQLGVKTEGPMRELFAAMHPELEVVHRPYDIYHQTERPWLFATLDGELRDRATGDMGILEIKKAECMNKRERESGTGRSHRTTSARCFTSCWPLAIPSHGCGRCFCTMTVLPR